MVRKVAAGEWSPGRVIAWTESDGPGRVPPTVSRRTGIAAAIALGVATFGVLTADTVCPEHALLIDIVASVAMVLAVVGIAATFKASAAAPVLVLGASVLGLGIAAVDALHDVTRDRIVAGGFALAAVAASFSALTVVRLRQWERDVLESAEQPLDASLLEAARPTAESGHDDPVEISDREPQHDLTS